MRVPEFREVRQEINAALNVVENWNGANDFVFYARNSEFATNDTARQEISMLCLATGSKLHGLYQYPHYPKNIGKVALEGETHASRPESLIALDMGAHHSLWTV